MTGQLTVFEYRSSYLVGTAVGAFLLLLAAVLWRFSSDRRSRGPLALFLVLVGSNYLLVAGQALAFGTWGLHPIGRRMLLAADVVQLFDPPVLLLAVAALVLQRVPRWLAGGAAFLAIANLALFAAGQAGGPQAAAASQASLRAMLAMVYAGSFAWLVVAMAREPRRLQRDRLAELVVAFGAVLPTRIPLSVYEWLNPPLVRPSDVAWMVATLAGLAAAAAILAWLCATRPARQALPRTFARLGLALAAVAATWLLVLEPQLGYVSFSLWYSCRWVVFAVAVVAGIHRIGLLDVGEAGARRLWLAFSVAAYLAMASLVWTFLSGSGAIGFLPGLFAGLVVAGLIHGLLLAALASRPSGDSMLEWRRRSLYRAHLELGTEEAELARLRERLGIPAAEARGMAALVRDEQAARGPEDPLVPGRLFAGRYEVRALLATGGFGRVLVAFDQARRETVVLKELLDPWRRDAGARSRFRAEVRALLKVSHPNLVGFRDLERAGDGHVLVLEHVEGPSLRERLAKGRMAPHQAARLGSRLLDAVATLHAAGVVHGDVKPENVVLRNGAEPVLLDFGAAHLAAGATKADAAAGTEGYLAPERRGGGGPTPAADVYAVGAVLWECVTGALPPRGKVPGPLGEVLRQALDPDPAQRPDAAAMTRALGDASG